jgi:hypothetical protein
MKWEIIEHPEDKFLEIITGGIADKDGSLSMAKEINKTMFAKRFLKVLIDHRKLISITGSILEIYERPKIFRVIGALLNIKIAEIINPEFRDHFDFLKTAGIIQGYRISVFENRNEAIRWLLK